MTKIKKHLKWAIRKFCNRRGLAQTALMALGVLFSVGGISAWFLRNNYLSPNPHSLLANEVTSSVRISDSAQLQEESQPPYIDPFYPCSVDETVSCDELGGLWENGTATCRPDRSGFDVSACRLKSSTFAEMVKPAERSPKRFEEARCNDGTPFGFEVQMFSPIATDWVIYLEGGGFCDDDMISCADRPESLRSSPDGDDRDMASYMKKGVLGLNKDLNPTFSSANHIFANYCSSDNWTGVTTQKRENSGSADGWYFSGRANVRTMIKVLQERYGLNDLNSKTKILFTGGSAGGAGVMANADSLTALLPETTKRGDLKILNDAGHIPDFDNPEYRPRNSELAVRTAVINATKFWGAKLNPLCMQNYPQETGKCFFADVVFPYIVQPKPAGLGLPFFLQVSSIDSYGTKLHGIMNAVEDEDAVAEYRGKSLESFSGIPWLFSGGQKPYHTTLTKDGPQGFHMVGTNGKTLQKAITRFWNNKQPERIIFGNP